MQKKDPNLAALQDRAANATASDINLTPVEVLKQTMLLETIARSEGVLQSTPMMERSDLSLGDEEEDDGLDDAGAAGGETAAAE